MMKILRNERLNFLWLVLRVWLGWQWLEAGLGKLQSATWVGDKAGTAISGFFNGAIANASGEHPSVRPLYAAFLKNFALPNAKLFSYLVPAGETLVGLALILGVATTFAAVMGAFMNLNFMMAGSTSTNPYMYTIAILIILAGANAGRIGLDRYVIPALRRRSGRETAADTTR